MFHGVSEPSEVLSLLGYYTFPEADPSGEWWYQNISGSLVKQTQMLSFSVMIIGTLQEAMIMVDKEEDM